MSFKLKFFLLILTLITSVSLITFFVFIRQKEQKYKPGLYSEFDQAVNQAKLIYDENKQLGKDFNNGPCLTNALLPGWVLDIVHVPRQPVDALPENQCSAFKEGSAKHVVELDLEGNLVRIH